MNIKKIVSVGVLSAVLLTSIGIHGYAQEVTVKIDEQKLECPVAATIKNGSTMVPMRAIFEALDMDVEWNDEEKSVTATNGEDTIKLTIGEKTMKVNGEEIELNSAPYIENGSTMVPVRAVSESVEATVEWNGDDYEVNITTAEYEENKDKWKENTGTINLDSMTVTGNGITVDGNVILITEGGDFEVTGENENAMIHVNTKYKVKLRLNGVKLTNPTGPAIFFENTNKSFITISKGSENYITDGAEYSVDAKAAIFSNDDLEIKGEGTLYVTSKAHHGIASDDDVKIEEGTVIISAEEKDGIHANNTIKIQGGDITITAKGDGIQSEEDVVIEGGEIDITTTGTVSDNRGGMEGGFGGMMGGKGNKTHQKQTAESGNTEQAQSEMMPRGGMSMGRGEPMEAATMPQGEGNMTPPDGMGNMQHHQGEGNMTPEGMGNMQPPQGEGNMQPEGMGNMQPPQGDGNMQGGFGQPMGDAQTAETEDTASSTRGIKAETDITISGGSIKINSNDDAIHCAATVTINGGELNLTSNSGKGISSHGDLVINDGVLTVNKATEGLESKANFTVNGGTISVTASDDGFNAGGTGARDVGAGTGHDLVINGGTIYVNASADGLDANGSIVINGGDIIVDGPTNNGNGALDSGASITVNGGTLIALGASGMAEAPGNNSTQPSFRLNTSSNFNNGTPITITNAKGEVIYSYTAVKSGNSIVFSSDKLTVGETYTVKVGEEEHSVTLTSVSTGGGAGGMMGGGGRRGW